MAEGATAPVAPGTAGGLPGAPRSGCAASARPPVAWVCHGRGRKVRASPGPARSLRRWVGRRHLECGVVEELREAAFPQSAAGQRALRQLPARLAVGSASEALPWRSGLCQPCSFNVGSESSASELRNVRADEIHKYVLVICIYAQL